MVLLEVDLVVLVWVEHQRVNMKKQHVSVRPDLAEKCEAVGFNYKDVDGHVYWDESRCYQFTETQIDDIDDITTELHSMAIEATKSIITEGSYDKYHIPLEFVPMIEDSWNKGEKHLYGRMDLCYTSDGQFKLFEYNADTPTSLLEASIVQWDWLCDMFPKADQFNSIHEKLIARWKEVVGNNLVYFTCLKDNIEDINTTEYLMRTATEAGLPVEWIFVDDIGHNKFTNRFVDLQDYPIDKLFKLYPSEWMLDEEFAQFIVGSQTQFVEPIWKVITSSKALLVKMWEMFPNHPNMLATYFEPDRLSNYARKPIFSREGANILINAHGDTFLTDGDYGQVPFIYQDYCELPKFGDSYALIGSWVIGDQAAGIGIREDSTLVTRNTSRFIPHYF